MRSWYVVITPVIGWFAAQGIKFLVNLRKDGFQIKDLYYSGGFPSSHTASTVALATYLGVENGWNSQIFVLAFMLASVVMYDALGVRRAVGEHVKLLKKIAAINKVDYKPLSIDTAFGHTPFEVFAGLVLGVIVGLLVSTI